MKNKSIARVGLIGEAAAEVASSATDKKVRLDQSLAWTPGSNVIVTVEDMDTMRNEVLQYIKESKSASSARNFKLAERAWEWIIEIKANKVDLVIADHQLRSGGWQGLDLVRMIRADPMTRHIPVIMITSSQDVSLFDQAKEAGVTGFYTKPIHRKIAAEVIFGLVQMSRTNAESTQALKTVLNALGARSEQDSITRIAEAGSSTIVPTEDLHHIHAMAQAQQAISLDLISKTESLTDQMAPAKDTVSSELPINFLSEN